MKNFLIFLALIALTFYISTRVVEHKVHDYAEWCEYLDGKDLQDRYSRPWEFRFELSVDKPALREGVATDFNQEYQREYDLGNKRAAWVKGTRLHIMNPSVYIPRPSGLFEQELVRNIEAMFQSEETGADVCRSISIGLLFDMVVIHTPVFDPATKVFRDSSTSVDLRRFRKWKPHRNRVLERAQKALNL